MKRYLLVLAALLAACAWLIPSGAAHGSVDRWTVTTFPEGMFAESLALGSDGYLYASLTGAETGQILKVRPSDGAQQPYGPEFGITSFLTGVAFDAKGHLYVSEVRYSDDFSIEWGVIDRIDAHGVTEVATMPEGTFPNGLAFHDGYLYSADSAWGAVWRVRPHGHTTLTTPWLQDQLLEPETFIGANGIAFRGDRVFVSVSDTGLIASALVKPNGSHGTLRQVVQDERLITADGIAFDPLGGLWIVTNGPVTGALYLLAPTGHLVTLADQPAWLDYPTQPVIGTTWSTLGTLFIANGSFDNLQANIVGLRLH